MAYVWQRLNRANHNHYICEITDNNQIIHSRYFDGTQAAAIAFFMRDEKISRYLKMDSDRYVISMRGNSIQLNWRDS